MTRDGLRRSRVRFLSSTLVGAVLVAATASSMAWSCVAAPSEQELREASAELVEGRPFSDVTTGYVDASHLGPRQIRGTFSERLTLVREAIDFAPAERIRDDAKAAGWDATIVRGPDEVSVEARRGDRLAEVTDRQLDLVATAPLGVNAAVAGGAIAGGAAGAALNVGRQRRRETTRTRGGRLAAAAGLLPGFALLAAAFPVFAVPGAADLVSDFANYGTLVLGVLFFFAGFWVPVGVVIAVVTCLVARPRPVRTF